MGTGISYAKNTQHGGGGDATTQKTMSAPLLAPTPEEIEKARAEYYRKYSRPIAIHKEMILQRALNKDFKIKLPINKICHFPVDAYFVFTHVAPCNDLYMRDYYKVDFHIYERNNPQKILFKDGVLKKPEMITFYSVTDYYKSDASLYVLDFSFLVIDGIIANLKPDTYLECFTEDKSQINYDNGGGGGGSNVEYCHVYTCKQCDGQTTRTNELCYFCAGAGSGAPITEIVLDLRASARA